MEQKKFKLETVLALVQDKAAAFTAMLKDYAKYFSNNQGSFKGMLNTYSPKDEAIDDPSKRGYVKVVTTVDEKLTYFINSNVDFLKLALSKEKTNASGLAISELIVDGKSYGIMTSNELLLLKNVLERPDLGNLMHNIPTRTLTDNWVRTTAEEYQSRNIWEKPQISANIKTTEKVQYVLSDPNIVNLKDSGSYKPQIATKDTVIDLGIQTRQEFSGEISYVEKAEMLERLTAWKDAVNIALKKCNEVEIQETNFDPKEMLHNIFFGNK